MGVSIRQLQQVLCERTEEFRVLRQIIEAVNSTLDLQAVLQRILELVSQVTSADACLLYLLDERLERLQLRLRGLHTLKALAVSPSTLVRG